jgi:hypothetical protein
VTQSTLGGLESTSEKLNILNAELARLNPVPCLDRPQFKPAAQALCIGNYLTPEVR